MNDTLSFSPLLQDLQRYSVQAVLSILGIRNKPLRAALEKRFGGLPGDEGNFLSAPLFEATFSWRQDNGTMQDLAGNGLLHPALVSALDSAKGDLHFPGKRRPYVHQHRAWDILLDETRARSAIISSGTGSGKTEAFMIPVLNDLARQAADGQKLRGVQAIFLYPLNALINNQRDRLRAWMKPFGGRLRFCLYNGMTPERPGRDRDPVEVADRKTLRADPPPVLVTNPTMLEFMLVRPQDAPVLKASRGQLKWIILDEAHTYLGSQAAELALLLRRVMEGFGVQAQDVRFIATSATIGGEDKTPLRDFLADIAGIDPENVTLIEGQRLIPELPDLPLENTDLPQLAEMKGEEFANALLRNRTARFIRNAFSEARGNVLRADQLAQKMREQGLVSARDKQAAFEETVRWLETCSRPEANSDRIKGPFLPLRMHVFHRVMGGLWACCNPECPARDEHLHDAEWPYGQIYLEQRLQCACGAPVYEVASCGECREIFLLAEEEVTDDSGRAIRQRNLDQEDEFSLLSETGEEEEQTDEEVEPEIIGAYPCLVLNRKPEAIREIDDLPDPESLHIAPDGAVVAEGGKPEGKQTFEIIIQSFLGAGEKCPRCQSAPTRNSPTPFRRMFLGAPFHLGTSLPILLSHLPKGENCGELPHDGQRLITFTDSRQGTARIAVHLQQGAELGSARSSIYRRILLSSEVMSRDESEKLKLLGEIADIKPTPENRKRLRDFKEKLQSRLPSVSWPEMVQMLAGETDISKWILDYYKRQDKAYFGQTAGEQRMAELLLLRELFRRPKWLNSLETMGLITLRWPSLDSLENCPEIWRRLGLSLEQWKSFLGIVIDHYLRANSVVDANRGMLNWLGIPAHPRRLVRWDREGYRRGARWLQFDGKGRLPRIGNLLARALNLDLSQESDRDIFNDIFRQAWSDLTFSSQSPLQANTQSEYALDFSRCKLVIPDKIWICPITGRALSAVFRGVLEQHITPYLPAGAPVQIGFCDDPISMPRPETGQGILDEARLKDWLAHDEGVRKLRTTGFWSDLHDGIVLGARFFSVAEHSAQQPGWLLQNYERSFKNGRINILSCSTTMELGVDIGGLSAVAMNDVPPHPANYLQRCGRAGRRHETRAASFTMCRNNAHEQMLFRRPEWPFETPSPVPQVGMDSEPIVQRHLNAHLLGQFLKSMVDDALHLNCRTFFLPPEDIDDATALVGQFQGWLERIRGDRATADTIRRLTRATISQEALPEFLIDVTLERIGAIAETWCKEHEGLREDMRQAEQDTPAKNASRIRLERFENEYLLKELATRAFLPAYGFPIHLAHFNYLSAAEKDRLKNFAKKRDRDDNRFWLYNMPTRDMGAAIREYAPGADVVMDGRVYKAAGIELSWKIPQTEDEAREPQDLRFARMCRSCGHVEMRRSWKKNRKCAQCGSSALDELEYLTPAGFSIDFSATPHNDVSHQTFVPPEQPFVAMQEEWTWLPDAFLGKWRSSRMAQLFQHSAGLHGHGYAICLACGRAESQTQKDELPGAFTDEHKRLRSASICRGSFNTWMIKKNLRLGFAQQTDIFQLALHEENGRWLDDKTIATSLAVAMRQALAQILGVEVEEFGYATTPLRLDGQKAMVITLYDSCSGGAGLASQAGVHLRTLLERTLDILHCGRSCESACHACLLSHDTRRDHRRLNRHAALDFLSRTEPLKRLELVSAASILGKRPGLEFTSLLRAITEQAGRADADGVFLQISSPADDWDLEEWPLMNRIMRWGLNGKQVRLLVNESALRDPGDEVRAQLIRLASSSNVQLMSGSSMRLDNRYHLLGAVLLKSGRNILWVCEDANASAPNGQWGQTSKSAIYLISVSGDEWKPPEALPVDLQALTSRAGESARNWRIGRELDGPIFADKKGMNSFGTRFLKLLRRDAPFLHEALQPRSIESISYTDRYINSPLSAALLASLLGAMKPYLANDASIQVTLANWLPAPRGEPVRIFHNWPDARERTDVVQAMFAKLGIPATIEERDKNRMDHARKLTLRFRENESLVILLDQGVGFWQAARGRSAHHDFLASVEGQARKLLTASPLVTAPQGQVTYIHAWK